MFVGGWGGEYLHDVLWTSRLDQEPCNSGPHKRTLKSYP